MAQYSRKPVRPAIREVVIFSVMGIGYIYGVWLLLFEDRYFLACFSAFGSLMIAALVDKVWRLNRLSPPLRPRHQRGLFPFRRGLGRDRTLNLLVTKRRGGQD